MSYKQGDILTSPGGNEGSYLEVLNTPDRYDDGTHDGLTIYPVRHVQPGRDDIYQTWSKTELHGCAYSKNRGEGYYHYGYAGQIAFGDADVSWHASDPGDGYVKVTIDIDDED